MLSGLSYKSKLKGTTPKYFQEGVAVLAFNIQLLAGVGRLAAAQASLASQVVNLELNVIVYNLIAQCCRSCRLSPYIVGLLLL